MRTDHQQQIEPTEKQIASFNRAAKALARLGNAGLHIYFASDSLCLLTGPSHDEKLVQQQNRVRASVNIPHGGGGDW